MRQFGDALEKCKTGKPFPVDELLLPPGYAPITVNTAAASKPALLPKPAPTPKPVHRETRHRRWRG